MKEKIFELNLRKERDHYLPQCFHREPACFPDLKSIGVRRLVSSLVPHSCFYTISTLALHESSVPWRFTPWTVYLFPLLIAVNQQPLVTFC